MKIQKIRDILNAEILLGKEFMDREVNWAFGADMMSDVLAHVKKDTLLITGLTNTQVIRTSEMIDINCIVFVRGKVPNNATIELARENKFVIMKVNDTLYTTCGKLYEKGLKGIKIKGENVADA